MCARCHREVIGKGPACKIRVPVNVDGEAEGLVQVRPAKIGAKSYLGIDDERIPRIVRGNGEAEGAVLPLREPTRHLPSSISIPLVEPRGVVDDLTCPGGDHQVTAFVDYHFFRAGKRKPDCPRVESRANDEIVLDALPAAVNLEVDPGIELTVDNPFVVGDIGHPCIGIVPFDIAALPGEQPVAGNLSAGICPGKLHAHSVPGSRYHLHRSRTSCTPDIFRPRPPSNDHHHLVRRQVEAKTASAGNKPHPLIRLAAVCLKGKGKPPKVAGHSRPGSFPRQ